jgi:hypothetical protein
MNVVELSEDSSSFRFPFTDNEDTDLNLSKNFHKLRGSKTLPRRDCGDSVDSSSDLSLGLSPISRSRDSDTSIRSNVGSIEGERLVLDYVDSTSNSMKSEGKTSSRLQSRNCMNVDGMSGREETEERKNVESSETSPSPNPSSSPSPTGSLQNAMKQVGEHSSNFIDKIRDAAHKRKVAVTRSRDSLVAKEQEQLRSIAECKTRFAALKQKLHNADEKNEEATKENNVDQFLNSKQSFKLSRKSNRSNNGFGGAGVPKVEKRPTTKALSPKLGLRRKGGKTMSKAPGKLEFMSEGGSTIRPTTKSSSRMRFNDTSTSKGKASGQHNQSRRNMGRESIEKEKNSSKLKGFEEKEASIGVLGVFKARPVPSSTTRRWNAGQLGIPKVSKRAVTVPVSPCLGPKRRPRTIVECSDKIHNENLKSKIKRNALGSSIGLSISSRSKMTSPSSVRGSPLLGLTLINSIRKEKITITKITITKPYNDNSTRTIFKPFVPRSTNRANMRKQYDIYRVEKHALGIQEKRERLRSQIKVIHRELKILRKDLT